MQIDVPRIGTKPERRCSECGALARPHAKLTRAIHDWEITFVECARLRCCGRTFTGTPVGVTARSRYSDRVVQLARALVSLKLPLRRCVGVLRKAGVAVTVEAVRDWCKADRGSQAQASQNALFAFQECQYDGRFAGKQPFVRIAVLTEPGGDLALKLRPGLWLALTTNAREQVAAVFEREFVGS